ncbi:ATP-binding cassette domain-containing protein, partial [Enterococcus faecalis]|uniref:ATP-binding cassette domain-containing protein n=1 Tax=Enterococcus faecalis TaxID=1351 RepID=UPI00100035B6
YGKEDATLEEMERAIDIAQATEFVSQKPQGYDEPLSEGGTNYSGGQKQRMCIARALIKPADVYIFDDSFSALDYKTDAALRAALHAQMADKTLLIVAQRLSTIMNADNI